MQSSARWRRSTRARSPTTPASQRPTKTLSQFRVACSSYRKARPRHGLGAVPGTPGWDIAALLEVQAEGPSSSGRPPGGTALGRLLNVDPSARLEVKGSEDAVLYLFRTPSEDIYAAYKLSGHEVVPLQLQTSEARLVRVGQPPKSIHAEAGAFLVALDTVPIYIVARRSAWPGKAAE